ncbi:MAG: hypothetical protein KBI02_02360 [Thermomonas sp.]|uniref:hypothetical protein n=1 Tax=Thermomonas sp. TaxID=1971895 RepID=UPI001B46E3BB|nr:hypothetical protein [Thermomonas sp.]MBK6923926.1 hypothetical protein [Thermomonas sp.]MBP6438856.1 hypothetical protein [Thermomonas sp.]MBP7158403.1 hypothetical protein [Thermomonas sp.]MBP7789217.1 hypothetical protein [Thermomonas sp.]MBP8615575.1 hypothetical protein [Thermomonas sp.]
MTNNINVTLDTSVTPHELKVHDHGHVRIDKKPGAQLISWNLTGNLAQGSFLPICGNSPGFEWVSDPPPPGGIFGEPQVFAKSLTLVDIHPDGGSDGTWIYRLRACLDGTVYSTSSSAGVSDVRGNPIIIND